MRKKNLKTSFKILLTNEVSGALATETNVTILTDFTVFHKIDYILLSNHAGHKVPQA